MTEPRVRFFELERGPIDLKTGEFPMVLATDGEATDGDILSIEGAQFPERVPLQLSHVNDVRATMGSAFGFRRDMTGKPKKLRARGLIEMEGEGPTAEIRRDVAFMASRGHVSGISVRWVPIKQTLRTALPKGHPAHVTDGERDMKKKYGVLHEKWRVLEATITPVQSDQEAFMGRAEELAETLPHVAEFWRAMAADARSPEEIEADTSRSAPQPPVEPVPEPVQEPEAPEEPEEAPPEAAEAPPQADPPAAEPEPSAAARLAAFAAQVREFKALGIDLDTLAQVIEAEKAPPKSPLEIQLEQALSRIAALEARDQERVNGEPLPPIHNADEFLKQYEQRLTERLSNAKATFLAAVNARRGIVSPGQTWIQQMHAEAEAIIRQAKAEADAPVAAALVERFESLVAEVRERLKAAPASEKK